MNVFHEIKKKLNLEINPNEEKAKEDYQIY
jgi:hypothetical protein